MQTDPGYLILADLQKPFSLSDLFGNNNPVEMEIGAGRGDFLTGYCEAHPDINLLAVERKLNYLKRGITKTRLRDLHNVRFLNVEVQHFVAEYLPDDSLQAVHIYFPDPWPKKRHLKRRIVQTQFVEMLARRIQLGGGLHLRTDHAHYFEHMMEVMGTQSHFIPVETSPAVSVHKTGFEARFVAQGLPIYYASYRLDSKPA